MSNKQELLKACDDGVKRNTTAISINSFFAGVNFFLAGMYFYSGKNGMVVFHVVLLFLHVGLAYGAVKLRTKWEEMRNDLTTKHS